MRGKAIAMTGVFGAALALAATAAMAQPASRAVRYGLNGPELDACTPYSEISGLNPRGDNYVSVRAAPSTGARELDRLGPGRKVWICEEVSGWAGIVYGPRASTGCAVESPVRRVRAYPGPCRSGWISARYVTPIAG